MDLSTPGATWAAGGAVFLIAIKVLWPLVKQFVETQTTQGRTESGLLNQLMNERNAANLRADGERESRIAAEQRADKHFAEMIKIGAEFTVLKSQMDTQGIQIDGYKLQIERLTLQVEASNKQVAELTRIIEELRRGGNAKDH